ncbi:MAG: hypothetical protein WCW13_00060 [archaeon]|jgi:hypothetical protein
MKHNNSAMPDLLGLKDIEKSAYAFVLDNWPSTPLEIAEQFKEDLSSREKKRRASTKYAYYLKKLIEKKLLLSKKAGNSIIVWPVMVEKYRAIHDILQQHEPEHLDILYHKHKEGERNA